MAVGNYPALSDKQPPLAKILVNSQHRPSYLNY